MELLDVVKNREFYRLRKYRIYPNLLKEYIKRPGGASLLQVISIHRKGFTVSDWKLLGLNNDNYKRYLTTKRYYKHHPLNGYYSKLIDDKMIIKYIFAGTTVGPFMPDYYFMIDEDGFVKAMPDCAVVKEHYSGDDVADLLVEKGTLAVKLATGSIGKGFYKAEYRDGNFYANGEQMDREHFLALLAGLKNYIISEYLRPHPQLAEIWPDTANTMRYLAGRVDGKLVMLKSFMRFGSKKSGSVENFNRGGVLCYVDEAGNYKGGYIIHRTKKELKSIHIDQHPDTGKMLDGVVPCWDQVQYAVQEIGKLLPQTRYLGFDFVVTDQGKVKLLEINSLTSMDSMQLDGSILDNPNAKTFFDGLEKK